MMSGETRSIVVFGRIWYPRAGASETSASVYVNGKHVAHLGPVTGHGDHYKDMAEDWLRENGYLDGEEFLICGLPRRRPLWHYRDDLGIELVTESAEVTRRGDL